MSEVQRLESLLSTIQQNRLKPRAGATPAGLNIAQPVAEAAHDAEISFADAAPSLPPAAASSGPKPELTRSTAATPTPIERAFEGELSAQAAVSSGSTGTLPTAAPAASATPTDLAAPARDGGVVREALNVPAPPAPGKPIAQAASSAPSMEEVSFGELLRRSLSLRPR